MVREAGLSSHCANMPLACWLPGLPSLSLVTPGIRFKSRICSKQKDTPLGCLSVLVREAGLEPARP